MSTRRVAVLIPGIMGSELRRKVLPDEPLWSSDLRENYLRLLKNPASLIWSDQPALARMIQTFHAGYGPFVLKRAHVWQGVMRALRSTREFSSEDSVVEFGYDWRGEIARSAQHLGASLGEVAGSRLEHPPTDGCAVRFVLIGHSMGGLVAVAALGTGAIHPDWVDRIVVVGSPLLGAPKAFKGAYGGPDLPFFEDLFRLVHGRNEPVFRQSLLACLQTFPSVYQLFPPKQIDYLRFPGGYQTNPLRDGLMDEKHKKLAETAHAQLAAGIQKAGTSNLKLISIFADYHQQDWTDLYYEVEPMGGRRRYEIVNVLGRTHAGDGTVPADSARGAGTFLEVPVQDASHAFLCNNAKVVDCLHSVL